MTNFIRIVILFPLISAFLLSCSENKTDNDTEDLTPNITLQEKESAVQLLKKNCYSCHTPNQGARLAPPMFKVKDHYIDEFDTEAKFIEAITFFVLNPNEENVRMPGAKNKFGLMPKSVFNEADVKLIAKYLFYANMEADFDEQSSHPNDTSNYLEIGKEIALTTKSALGKQLFAAIEKSGAHGAVEFCNIEAIPITDSMAVALNTKVKRVSDLPRNPNNKANEMESNFFDEVRNTILKGEEVKPKLQIVNGKRVGYYPILTNGMCLQCHGNPENQIESITLSKIHSLYPKDLATGYSENQIRGLFVVEMD
jgi:cytochrome c551/c552